MLFRGRMALLLFRNCVARAGLYMCYIYAERAKGEENDFYVMMRKSSVVGFVGGFLLFVEVDVVELMGGDWLGVDDEVDVRSIFVKFCRLLVNKKIGICCGIYKRINYRL